MMFVYVTMGPHCLDWAQDVQPPGGEQLGALRHGDIKDGRPERGIPWGKERKRPGKPMVSLGQKDLLSQV